MAVTVTLVVTVRQNTSCAWEGRAWFVSPVQFVRNLTTRLSRFNSGGKSDSGLSRMDLEMNRARRA